jgi:thiosulfate/3-mercaptopyruvate sulfurtransferase
MNLLITPSWLASRLHDTGTVVLDATLPPVGVTPPVDTRARYLANHIPGAIFFDIDELSGHTTPLPHMLPNPEVFSLSMSALGIGDHQAIVIYEQEGVFSAPRAWWMLRTLGAQDLHILDGGLRAWIEGGFPTDSGHVQRAPASFHAELDHDAVKDFAQIQRMIAERAQMLDARSAARFTGASPEPRPGISSGHMPGAINVPFTELVEDGYLKSVGKLRELFKTKGVDMKQPVTTTCGSGVTAAVIALCLEIAGAKQVSLYDGSWAEYAQHPEAVIDIDPDEYIENLVTRHKVDDDSYVEELSQSMKAEGWTGRPLLVRKNKTASGNCEYVGITGTHRAEAAMRIGCKIPVVVIDEGRLDGKQWKKVTGGGKSYPELASFFDELGLNKAAELMRMEIKFGGNATTREPKNVRTIGPKKPMFRRVTE